MQQVIPENISQVLLKRLIIFLGFVLVAIIVLHFQPASVGVSYQSLPSMNSLGEINKTDIIFSTF